MANGYSLLAPKQPSVPIYVPRERVHRERRGDGQGDRDEAAVELVPVLGDAVVLPAERLAGVAEGEPGDRGADEDVLEDGLELPRTAGRDDDAPALDPPAESGHRQLPADEQQADPERNAAPERDVVEIVPLPRDPVDRDQGGEEQQLVGDRVEEDAEIGDLLPAAGEAAVEDVAHRGGDEDHEADELGPVAFDERQERDDRGEADPDDRDDVGQRP